MKKQALEHQKEEDAAPAPPSAQQSLVGLERITAQRADDMMGLWSVDLCMAGCHLPETPVTLARVKQWQA